MQYKTSVQPGGRPADSPDNPTGEHAKVESTAGRGRAPLAALVFSLVLYTGIVFMNAPVVFLGHVALSHLPAPAALSPFMQAYTIASLRSTLGLSALGSLAVLFPLFFGTLAWTMSQVRPTSTLATVVRSAKDCAPFSLPPVVKYVLSEAWMISAGPVGSLLYERRHPSFAEVILDPGHAALASLTGELIVTTLNYIWRTAKGEVGRGELGAERERIAMEEGQAKESL